MNCAWCDKEFHEGMFWNDIMRHMVGCFNEMLLQGRQRMNNDERHQALETLADEAAGDNSLGLRWDIANQRFLLRATPDGKVNVQLNTDGTWKVV